MTYQIKNNDSLLNDFLNNPDFLNDLAKTKKSRINKAVVDNTYFEIIIKLLDNLFFDQKGLNSKQKKLITELRDHFEMLKDKYILIKK
jgi:hypothetical protein